MAHCGGYPGNARSAIIFSVTPRERAIEALSTWQRTDRNRDLNTLITILEAEFARLPGLDTVGAVMSAVRKQGWQKVPPEERRERMRALAKRPRRKQPGPTGTAPAAPSAK